MGLWLIRRVLRFCRFLLTFTFTWTFTIQARAAEKPRSTTRFPLPIYALTEKGCLSALGQTYLTVPSEVAQSGRHSSVVHGLDHVSSSPRSVIANVFSSWS